LTFTIHDDVSISITKFNDIFFARTVKLSQFSNSIIDANIIENDSFRLITQIINDPIGPINDDSSRSIGCSILLNTIYLGSINPTYDVDPISGQPCHYYLLDSLIYHNS
jgi:hypothetical protein